MLGRINELKVRIVILLLSGSVTFLLELFFSVTGGGASLIFVLSKPIFIAFGVVFSMVLYFIKNKKKLVRDIVFYSCLLFQVLMAIVFYPFK